MGYCTFFSSFRPVVQPRQTSSSMHCPQAIRPQSLHEYSFFDGFPHIVHMPADSIWMTFGEGNKNVWHRWDTKV
jgi:hypothetical protein